MSKSLALFLLIGLLSLSPVNANRKTMASDRSLTFGGAFESPVAARQGGRSGAQKYSGLWVGTFSGEKGPGGDISYTLSRDSKGQWRGALDFKYRNQPEKYKADLQSIQITGEKMKANIIEMPGIKGGSREARVEGQFQGERLEGSLTISPKGSTDITNTWTWKTTKSATAKPGQ